MSVFCDNNTTENERTREHERVNKSETGSEKEKERSYCLLFVDTTRLLSHDMHTHTQAPFLSFTKVKARIKRQTNDK